MACSITITSVVGIPMGGGSTTSSIHVTGTLSGDCEPVTSPWAPIKYDVVVIVDCGGGPVSATTLSSGGSWACGGRAVGAGRLLLVSPRIAACRRGPDIRSINRGHFQ